MGSVDPDAVKHEVKVGQERLPIRPSTVFPNSGRAGRSKSPDSRSALPFEASERADGQDPESALPDPVVDPIRFARIEQHYLDSCFQLGLAAAIPDAVVFDRNDVRHSAPLSPRWDEDA